MGASLVLAALGLGALAARYWGVDGADGAEAQVGRLLQDGLAEHREVLRWIVALADPLMVLVWAIVIAVGCLALGRRRLAVVALVGPVLTGIATTLLQPLIKRTLNGLDGWDALPSGHTGAASSVALVLALIAVSFAGTRPVLAGAIAGCAAILVALGMSVALIGRGYHHLTDTIAGFCVAVLVVLGVALFVDRLASNFHRG